MSTETKKKRGRPVGYRSDNPADKTLPKVRVTTIQLESYKAASVKDGKTLSAWVRDILDKATK